jgi:pilus assembly protein Flp/PilA
LDDGVFEVKASRKNINCNDPSKKENAMLKKVQNFLKEEEGATMVEYGLMVALIAVVVMAAVGPLGTTLKGMFDGITGELPAIP